MSNNKPLLELHHVMISTFYFQDLKDIINLVKVSRKFKDLLLFYRTNPVSLKTLDEFRLFPKIETYHFYTFNDFHPQRQKEIVRNNICKYIVHFEVPQPFIDQDNIKYLITNEEVDLLNLKPYYNATHLTSKNNISVVEGIHIDKIVFGNKVRNIENDVFDSVDIREVILNPGIQYIGVFTANEALTEIIIPDSVEIIPNECFNYCSNLKKVKLSNNLKLIGRFGFGSCKKLENIEIHDGCELSICSFINCRMLNRVVLPQSLKIIPSSCFSGCTSLKNINCENIITIEESGLRHTNIKFLNLSNVMYVYKLGLGMNEFDEVIFSNKLLICESGIKTKKITIPKKIIGEIDIYGCNEIVEI